ncbi:unnamed protein product [Arctogadus glacialis]
MLGLLSCTFTAVRNSVPSEECFLDSDLSFLVPIAVGVALSFLIILVLISYLIGRRKSRTGYHRPPLPLVDGGAKFLIS